MFDRMSPAQKAAAKAEVGAANDLTRLAIAANGHGVSRIDKDKANDALVRQVGRKKAAQVKEEALRRSGAGRKGLRDLFS
jgi:hypothetical protein